MTKPSAATRALYIEIAFAMLREAAICDGMDEAVREADKFLTARQVNSLHCQRCDGEGKWTEQGICYDSRAIDPPEKTVICPDCDGKGEIRITGD